MSGHQLLRLSNHSPTKVRDASHMLLLHTEALAMAESGFAVEAISRFRMMYASGLTPEHCTFEDMLWQIFQAIRSSAQKRYDSLEEEIVKISRQAIGANGSNPRHRKEIEAMLPEAILDLRELVSYVGDLGIIAQLCLNMRQYGIEDEIVAWIESELTPPAVYPRKI